MARKVGVVNILPEAEEQEPCDHEWKFIDDSFDHEFGTEQIYYDECQKCGETRKCQGKEWYDYE